MHGGVIVRVKINTRFGFFLNYVYDSTPYELTLFDKIPRD